MENFQFPGKGQRLTPVATLQVFLEILVLLPGKLANTIREEAVRTLIRAMNGDPTLVEEIIARIKDPQDLRDLEESIKTRRLKAYGDSSLPNGTLSNPLVDITPEIKKGYGWHDKSEEMVNLLADLATHVGDIVMFNDSYLAPRYYCENKSPKSLFCRWLDTTHVPLIEKVQDLR